MVPCASRRFDPNRTGVARRRIPSPEVAGICARSDSRRRRSARPAPPSQCSSTGTSSPANRAGSRFSQTRRTRRRWTPADRACADQHPKAPVSGAAAHTRPRARAARRVAGRGEMDGRRCCRLPARARAGAEPGSGLGAQPQAARGLVQIDVVAPAEGLRRKEPMIVGVPPALADAGDRRLTPVERNAEPRAGLLRLLAHAPSVAARVTSRSSGSSQAP